MNVIFLLYNSSLNELVYGYEPLGLLPEGFFLP